ncbi:MAG: ubiquinone/menaquinone biosynthesis C-methylase UbiE [Halieaceae bacterium]|jgi:ubiquinone/menaquinone biosynthesis C-methylase UbiE
MMDRRELLNLAAIGTAAATGATALLRATEALAMTDDQILADVLHAPRGTDGRHVRLGSFDVESRQEFTKGFRAMHGQRIRSAANEALDRLLEREGIDPTQKIDVPTMLKLIDLQPAINISSHAWVANQRVTWKNLQDYFHANEDAFLSEMEATDRGGPGTLELKPRMRLPEHVCHQIHIQPGGYVGDPFAGHMYHYGTNSFYLGGRGHNDQDQIHREAASKIPVPADGKVRRILDYGCGMGQFSLALKERFPDAEVWGLDIGGPMIRYGHMRAAHLNYDVNYVQRLAEDNGFPDGYFDIITSFIAHHEMPADVTRQVIAEAQRSSRPGAVYYPVDFISGGSKMIPRYMFGRWWDHRWNNERWSFEYHALDFAAEIEARGFTKAADPKTVIRGFGVRHYLRA